MPEKYIIGFLEEIYVHYKDIKMRICFGQITQLINHSVLLLLSYLGNTLEYINFKILSIVSDIDVEQNLL